MTYYYAIREATDNIFRSIELGKSLDVTHIAQDNVPYRAIWLHNDVRKKSRHLSMIEKWEYDMLDVLGVSHLTVNSVFKWGTHVPEIKE